MTRRLSLLLALALLGAPTAGALEQNSLRLLNRAWPDVPAARVGEIGRGVGVVFSPDLSVKENCRFYEALGFACFQDADWSRVFDSIHRYNVLYPERRLSTLLLETHGTNGNGLKLQRSYDPKAERSYVAVGALQERLEAEGIYYVIISACNSGRLLRPEIYNALDRNNGDKLFLPATCGIFDASTRFRPWRSAVTIITPESSHIETTLVGTLRELAAPARAAVVASAKARGVVLPKEFAVSDMLVQMLTRDPALKLAANHAVDQLSRDMAPVDRSEELFRRFTTYLNAVALREGYRAPAKIAAKKSTAKAR
jgi:hypothetical protein